MAAASGSSRSSSPDLDLFELLLRLGDDRLVLGHRLSEWCGHGPILEEDIALANIALDLVGQANLLLGLAGTVEGAGRDADALAYFREAVEFRNCRLVELPRGDFGMTMMRQFLFDVWSWHHLGRLRESSHAELAGLAERSRKETTYHLRHSSTWVARLGDGTEESHARVQQALNELWRFTGELFVTDEVDARLAERGVAPDPATLREPWEETVREVLARATLHAPEVPVVARPARRGDHTEHLGHLLAEMQILARSHPGASW